MFKPLSGYTVPVFVTDRGDHVVTVERSLNYVTLKVRDYDGDDAFAGELHVKHGVFFSAYADNGPKTPEEATMAGLESLKATITTLEAL